MKWLLLICLLLASCVTPQAPTNDLFIFSLGDTGSMEPALSVGDIVYLDRGFPYDQLEVGDVIAYYDPKWGIDYGLLHRVHVLSKNEPKEWIIKGDANRNVDPFNLTEKNYHGKVVRVDF